MKKDGYIIKLSFYLLGMSFLLYLTNFVIFKDLHDIAFFLTGSLAFIPIEVLVTVAIINQILERRDKKKKLQKINILLEVFFEEVGNGLLCRLSSKDKNCCEIGCLISEIGEDYQRDISRLRKTVFSHKEAIELDEEAINNIYELLKSNKDIFIKFLENPYLSAHDSFTDLLQAVSHLYHEIRFRRNNRTYNEEDMRHLREDVGRVYRYLLEEWLVYIEYIQREYPFLFNLAIKNVPFTKIKK